MRPLHFQLCALVVLTGMFAGGLATRAQARLGETREQLIERYGEPLRESKVELPASDSATVFFKELVEIHVEFKNGKAWMVTYRMHKLTSELEAQFRDANDGEDGTGDWNEPVEHLGRSYWSTMDGKIFGVRYFLGNGQIYRFCTSACRDALVQAREEQIDNAIAGISVEAVDTSSEEVDAAKPDNKSANPF